MNDCGLGMTWTVLLVGAVALAAGAEPVVWSADPLVKVFRDTPPPTQPTARLTVHAARDEYESAQLCVRSAAPLRQVRLGVGELRGAKGVLPAETVSWNPVGYVPVKWNTYHTPPGQLIRKAPFECPDPLLPAKPADLPANVTQPFWVTVHVPRDAEPGDYTGSVAVQWDGGQASVPVSLTVWPFALPREQHLAFTNWIDPGALAKYSGVAVDSDAFYDVLAEYARACAAHHQNILWVGLDTIGITEQGGGGLQFDFTRFDRWVETVTASGCGRLIEIKPLGRWAKGWDSPEIALHGYTVTGADGTRRKLSAEACLPHLLPALEAHLKQHGWLQRTVLHIADEPAVQHVASYREKSDWVHSLAPGIRRIDAIEAPEFGDSVEIWVPKLNHLYNWLPHYQRAQARGAEMWFYTCCHPTASYPNRFLDFPLLSTRLLQWYNWRYKLSGYLHWGLNFWVDDPLHSAGRANLPPGDCWIVYPGPDGPLSSIRWEALRDGFEDYEYLWLLTDRNRKLAATLEAPPALFDPGQRSDELAFELVHTMVDFCRDPKRLRRVREAIAAEVMATSAKPAVLVATDPPTSHHVAGWPIVVETKVWAEPEADVKVNGHPAFRQPGGYWAHHTFLDSSAPEVKVEVTIAAAVRTVVRRFSAPPARER